MMPGQLFIVVWTKDKGSGGGEGFITQKDTLCRLCETAKWSLTRPVARTPLCNKGLASQGVHIKRGFLWIEENSHQVNEQIRGLCDV